jgi:proteic killer suppression protein
VVTANKRQLSVYDLCVIKRFQHRGLKKLYEDDDRRGINAEHVEKVRRIPAHLKSAARPEDMDIPGFRLHPLKWHLAGFWSVTVRANWRIILRFEDGDVTDVDLIDYH